MSRYRHRSFLPSLAPGSYSPALHGEIDRNGHSLNSNVCFCEGFLSVLDGHKCVCLFMTLADPAFSLGDIAHHGLYIVRDILSYNK